MKKLTMCDFEIDVLFILIFLSRLFQCNYGAGRQLNDDVNMLIEQWFRKISSGVPDLVVSCTFVL